jgi:tetratricopeptide (TPR) repeat protein
MAVLEQPLSDEFERLHAEGQTLAERGRLAEGAELFARALALAEEQGDRRRADLAFCNRCAFLISLEGSAALDPPTMNRLREILLRNEDAANCFLAAYNLARTYELRKEIRKGLFYARIALDRSQLVGRQEWIASSHNQIGNSLMAQSFFGEAVDEYRSALDLYPESAAERRALVLLNVGYALAVRGERQRAFSILVRCLRTLRRLGSRRGEMFAHIDLCYVHLEAGRFRDALRHGARGLAMAEELAEADAVKNALYLLGETAQLAGDEDGAGDHFSRLAEEFYPGSSGIAHFLMAVDVRKMINLRA